MSYRDKDKSITVLGPDGEFLSKCSADRADCLLASHRAEYISPSVVMLKETKQERSVKKKDIIEQANFTCYICGEVIPEDEATIDHMIPKSVDRRHADVYSNMRCCCYRCNNDKCNRTLVDYVKHIMFNKPDYPYLTDEKVRQLWSYAVSEQKKFYDEIGVSDPTKKIRPKLKKRRRKV